jgi:hypothetical protein
MSGMNITSEDVIEIIKACKNSRVTRLSFGDLHLLFDTENHPNKTKKSASHMDVSDVSTVGEGHPHGPSHPDPQVEDETFTVTELADQLAIEDPAAYEELQMRGFLKGDDN